MQDTIAFLRSVLPRANYYAAVIAEPGNPKYQQKAVASVEQLAGILLSASKEGKHAFYGMSGFAQGWHDDPTGRRNDKGDIKKTFRTQANASVMKAFWLDLDVGQPNPKKSVQPYTTQAEAAADLVRFIKVTGLPIPTMVNSGGGLHIYWRLTQEINAANWNKIAALLDAVVKQTGLRADPSRTMDAASILRPIGTVNWKEEYGQDGHPVSLLRNQSPVEPMAFVQALRGYASPNGINPTTPTSSSVKLNSNVPAALQGMMHNPAFMSAMGHVMTGQEAQDKNPVRIVQLCQQVREAGMEMEPVWFNMMTVMKCCDRGRAAARILSKRDPRYNESQFEEKFNYVESLTGGPALCSAFDRECPGKCGSCPYNGKISSPAELGREMRQHSPDAQAQPVQLQLPTAVPSTLTPIAAAITPPQTVTVYTLQDPRYDMVEGEGLYYLYEAKVEGSDAPIIERQLIQRQCFYLLYAQNYAKSFSEHEVVYIFQITAKDHAPRQVRMRSDDFKSDANLRKWMFDAQLLTTPGKEKLQADCMRTYIAQMQRKIPQIAMRDHFGWATSKAQDGTNSTGFVVGDTLLSGAMPQTTVGLSRALESYATENLSTSGTLEDWKLVSKFYSRNELLWGQLGICLGFGAPLMRFAPGNAKNGIVNFWSQDSGTGKTTLQLVINSIWGHPERQLLNVQSTTNSRFRIMGWRNSLPVCINEMTNISEAELSDTLFQISEGREKERMDRSEGLQWSGSWNTITVMSANNTVLDKMLAYSQQRDGEIKRALDIEIAKSTVKKDEAVGMTRVMERNYGHAGRLFLQKLMDNQNVFKQLPQVLDRWVTQNSVSQDERYWENTVAVAVVAGKLAKAMGLIDFDMEAVEKYALGCIAKMRGGLLGSKSTGESLMADFLSDKLRDMLVVETAERIGGIDATMPTHMDNYIKRMPQGTLDLRMELDTRTVYVRKKVFHKWCSEQNLSARSVLGDLVMKKVYDPMQGTDAKRGEVQIRMARGVPTLANSPVRCYKLVLNSDADLEGFIGSQSAPPDPDTTD